MSTELDGDQVGQRMGEYSQSFLLRCWLEPDESLAGGAAWRFILTHINKNRDKKGFADLEAVVTYLQHILTQTETHFSGEK